MFITLHAQLERLKIEGIVDVFQFIKSARGQREGLVTSPVSSHAVDTNLSDIVYLYENLSV